VSAVCTPASASRRRCWSRRGGSRCSWPMLRTCAPAQAAGAPGAPRPSARCPAPHPHSTPCQRCQEALLAAAQRRPRHIVQPRPARSNAGSRGVRRAQPKHALPSAAPVRRTSPAPPRASIQPQMHGTAWRGLAASCARAAPRRKRLVRARRALAQQPPRVRAAAPPRRRDAPRCPAAGGSIPRRYVTRTRTRARAARAGGAEGGGKSILHAQLSPTQP
jgi:hypothetical protein